MAIMEAVMGLIPMELTMDSMFFGVGGLIVGFLLGYLIAWKKYYWKYRHTIETFRRREEY